MWIWRHERRWKSFPFKLLLTPFCYWMYCGRRGWKVGPPPSRWVPFLMKNWNPPLLALDKCEGYQPLNDFNEVAEPCKNKNLVKHCCVRSNIGSYTCCGCRQLKYTLMNYASTNTRNPSVQSTPPPLIFVLEGLYQQYHAWIYVAIGCVNLTSISEKVGEIAIYSWQAWVDMLTSSSIWWLVRSWKYFSLQNLYYFPPGNTCFSSELLQNLWYVVVPQQTLLTYRNCRSTQIWHAMTNWTQGRFIK